MRLFKILAGQRWRFDETDCPHVFGPLKVTGLILTMPEKVLSATTYAPVKRPEIYLKDLMVAYDPPEVAFAAE